MWRWVPRLGSPARISSRSLFFLMSPPAGLSASPYSQGPAPSMSRGHSRARLSGRRVAIEALERGREPLVHATPDDAVAVDGRVHPAGDVAAVELDAALAGALVRAEV